MSSHDWPVELDSFYGCWLWTGRVKENGYGAKGLGLAHRAVWTAEVGPIADGMVLDHLCRRRLCVRPEHLEAVTQSVNLKRLSARGRHSKTGRCPRGHDLFTMGRKTQEGGEICLRCCGMR
jgi:hypothetical protein